MVGTEAGHVSNPKKRKVIVAKSENVMSEAQTKESSVECEPYYQHCSNDDNENPAEDKDIGDEIYEESDEDPEDVIDEQPEEYLEEEIYEESDENPEDVIEEEIDGKSEDLQEEIVEDPEDSEEEIIEDSDEEELAVENSHLSSPMISGTSIKDLGNELNEDPEEERRKKVVEESGSHTILKSSREHDGAIDLSKVIKNGECASEQQEHGGNTGKQRRSRWDLKQEGETLQNDGNSKRRKTRWDSNSQNGSFNPSGIINSLEILVDPKIISLKVKLMEINNKLQSPEIYDDDRLAGERSPSPEPVYNNLGIRVNTREARIRKKLMNEKQHILSELANKTKLNVKPPAEHKPAKLVKKLFVPEKKYPTYNFIGLILGPKGNTQKKMEKETGAKIILRGKGSGEPDTSEDEDLHVRVEADNQKSLDSAVVMIEKLLIPMADRDNDHKRAQLVELAKLRGTYKDNNICDLCKEQGHRKYACPFQESTFKDVCCDICGSFSHITSNCSVSISQQISNILQGSSGVEFGSKDKTNKEVDHASIYVGYLSTAIDEKRLKELFLPFGKIITTNVIKDQTTGLSKGYGFVKFENPSDADAAVTYMNGYKMDGKMLAVRVAGQKPAPGSSNSGHVTIPSSHTAETPFSTMSSESLCFPSASSYPGDNITVARTEALNAPPYITASMTAPRVTRDFSSGYDFLARNPSSLPNSVSQFPGHPDYQGSQFKSYFTSPTMNETQSMAPEKHKRSNFWSAFHFP